MLLVYCHGQINRIYCFNIIVGLQNGIVLVHVSLYISPHIVGYITYYPAKVREVFRKLRERMWIGSEVSQQILVPRATASADFGAARHCVVSVDTPAATVDSLRNTREIGKVSRIFEDFGRNAAQLYVEHCWRTLRGASLAETEHMSTRTSQDFRQQEEEDRIDRGGYQRNSTVSVTLMSIIDCWCYLHIHGLLVLIMLGWLVE